MPAAAEPAPHTRPPRLYLIDGLRFVAAVGVVLYHYTVRWSQSWGAEPGHVFPDLGPIIIYAAMGPELFFVISGFVILMTAWGRDVPHVVASRLARLYPSYWIAVIATSVLLIWIWPDGKDISVSEALVNLTMLQQAFDVRHVDGVYWTLWTELRFYVLIVALVAIGITRRRVLWFCALWPLAAQVALIAGWQTASTVLVDGFAPYFAAGMLLFLVYREGHAPAPWVLLGLNVALAVHNGVPSLRATITKNTIFTPDDRLLAALLVLCFATVALIALTPLRSLSWSWLVPVGALTYPLYLIHEFWGWWVVDHLAPHAGRWVVLGAACAAALTLAWGIYQAEKRIGPRMRRAIDAGLRWRPRTAPALGTEALRPALLARSVISGARRRS